jgi:hypothetical protein
MNKLDVAKFAVLVDTALPKFTKEPDVDGGVFRTEYEVPETVFATTVAALLK